VKGRYGSVARSRVRATGYQEKRVRFARENATRDDSDRAVADSHGDSAPGSQELKKVCFASFMHGAFYRSASLFGVGGWRGSDWEAGTNLAASTEIGRAPTLFFANRC